MTPHSYRDFLELSLKTLALEAPGSYARVCETLAGRLISVDGDDRPFAVQVSATSVRFLDEVGPTVDISTWVEGTTVLALLDGAVCLEDALRGDGLMVRGSVADTADLFDGLLTYVRGAIRCPSAPALLSRFRGSVVR